MSDQIFHDSEADRAFKAKALYRAGGNLWDPNPMGIHCAVPDLLDHHDQLQDGARRYERKYHPLLGLYTEMARLAVAWAIA